jgi:16S rRNA (cytosine1402-N4)-methyltransferase
VVHPTVHVPVLLHEVLHWSGLDRYSSHAESNPTTGPIVAGSSSRTVIDGTLGGGGHAWHLIQKLSTSDLLVGIDRDERAIEQVTSLFDKQLPQECCRVRLIHSSYRDLPSLMKEHDIPKADCILLDLGLSSDQLEDRERGFSFRAGGDLDMRFCTDEGIAVRDLLAKIDERDLADIIYQFGEERFSRRIAKSIVERRATDPVRTAEQLADLVHRCVPGKVHGRIDSATRTFQALRIAVNKELEHVQDAMKRLPECLAPGGRLLVISFHSLEDRIVKHAMRENESLSVLTKKPIEANEAETYENSRSRSAKLRVGEKKS